MLRGQTPINIMSSVSDLLNSVLSHHSGLKNLIDSYGSMSLNDYYDQVFRSEGQNISAFALSAMSALAEDYLGREVEAPIKKTYSSRSVIDTAIHGGLVTEPQSFQAAAMQAHSSLGNEVLIILACTAVRLNTQTFPRGVLHRGKRYPLFRNDDEQKLTYSCPPLTKELVQRFSERTQSAGVNTDWLLGAIESTPELFDGRFSRFVEQATLLDERLLEKAFSKIPDAPKVLILPLEDLTTKLLLKSFEEKDTFYRMIFEEELRDDALKTFDDIQGAWKGSVGGNHFFVGANEKGDQTALIVKDGKLIGRDRDFELDLTPEAITEALNSRRIAPGVFLSLQLCVLHGITPAGAYFQIRYLPEMMQRMHDYLERYSCCCEWADRIKSNLMSYGFLYALDDGEPLSLEAAVKNPEQFASLLARGAKMSVKRAFINNLPAIYREVVPKAQQEDSLRKITYAECFQSPDILI